jgi:hypothetical protein
MDCSASDVIGTFGTPGQLIFHEGGATDVSDCTGFWAREVGRTINATIAGKAIFDNVDVRTESPLRVSGKKPLIWLYQESWGCP